MMDNDTSFGSEETRTFLENVGIIDGNHRTVKRVAEQSNVSVPSGRMS